MHAVLLAVNAVNAVNATGSEAVAQLQGEAYDSVQLNQTIDEWEAVQNECPVVLCKTRFPGWWARLMQ